MSVKIWPNAGSVPPFFYFLAIISTFIYNLGGIGWVQNIKFLLKFFTSVHISGELLI